MNIKNDKYSKMLHKYLKNVWYRSGSRKVANWGRVGKQINPNWLNAAIDLHILKVIAKLGYGGCPVRRSAVCIGLRS